MTHIDTAIQSILDAECSTLDQLYSIPQHEAAISALGMVIKATETKWIDMYGEIQAPSILTGFMLGLLKPEYNELSIHYRGSRYTVRINKKGDTEVHHPAPASDAFIPTRPVSINDGNIQEWRDTILQDSPDPDKVKAIFKDVAEKGESALLFCSHYHLPVSGPAISLALNLMVSADIMLQNEYEELTIEAKGIYYGDKTFDGEYTMSIIQQVMN